MEKGQEIQRKLFLEVVTDDYLKGILKKKGIPDDKLKQMIGTISNKKVINLKSKLKNISHIKLVQLFVEYEILTIDEEKELYLEFRDSKDPTFFLFKFQGIFKKPDDEIVNFIKDKNLNSEIKFINKSALPFEPEKTMNKYIDLEIIKYKYYPEHSILEVNFEYLERLDYLKKDYIPSYVYTLKSGFFWLDKANILVIFKCQNIKIVEAIVAELGQFFNLKYWKFNLNKFTIDKILDKKDMIKNILKANKTTNPDLFNSMIIRDVKYNEKARNPKFNFLLEYESHKSDYRTKIKGIKQKVKISVSKTGKITLRGKNIKLDKCREWLIELLIKIMDIQQQYIANGEIKSYLKSNDNITRSELYMNLRTNNAKKKLIDLINLITILKSTPKLDNIEFEFPFELFFSFSDYLIPILDLRCETEECDASIICPNDDCDSIDFKLLKIITERGFKVKCNQCNKEITEKIELNCIDDHNNTLNLGNSIIFVFHPRLKIEINNFLSKINIPYQINDEKEIFFIENNKLIRKQIKNKITYSWEELPIFKDVPQIKDLSNEVIQNQILNIKNILEKCDNRIGKCRNCDILKDKDEICLLSKFAEFSGGQAHPHSGNEFGDFEFPQDFSEGRELIIGIAKSYKKPSKDSFQLIYDKKFDLLTFKKNDNLFEQLFQLANEDTIRFIMIVSGRVIDTNLKAAIIEIAKFKNKKIVIIEPKDLIRIFSKFF